MLKILHSAAMDLSCTSAVSWLEEISPHSSVTSTDNGTNEVPLNVSPSSVAIGEEGTQHGGDSSRDVRSTLSPSAMEMSVLM